MKSAEWIFFGLWNMSASTAEVCVNNVMLLMTMQKFPYDICIAAKLCPLLNTIIIYFGPCPIKNRENCLI